MEEPAGNEPDGLKAYLPPEGPQSIHNVGYEFFERVGVHRIGGVALYGPEAVILTADEDAQRELERRNLDELPAEAAWEVLSAYHDGDSEQVAEIAAEYRSGETDGSMESTDEGEEALRGSVNDLKARLSTGEYDHRLDELERAERDGENRTTAIEVIQRRRGTLADPPEDAGSEVDA
jgi:hypothetical protein